MYTPYTNKLLGATYRFVFYLLFSIDNTTSRLTYVSVIYAVVLMLYQEDTLNCDVLVQLLYNSKTNFMWGIYKIDTDKGRFVRN